MGILSKFRARRRFNKLFVQAIKEYHEKEMREIEEKYKDCPIEPSPEFRRKMELLINNQIHIK